MAHLIADQLLTATEVANLTGLPDLDAVSAWAHHHRIRPTPIGVSGWAYPAGIVRLAAAHDRRIANAVAARYRLTRFIRNPLNRLT